MSIICHLRCDDCKRVSGRRASRPQDLRPLAGWTAGYVHKPYAGKRADFCPRCSAKRATAEAAR